MDERREMDGGMMVMFSNNDGVRELEHALLWFALLDGSFCLLRSAFFHFVPLYSPLFCSVLGAFGSFMIGRVSSSFELS
jgi:hypothetical protein